MAKQRVPDDWQEKVKMPIAELGMSVRTTNTLDERGIHTVNDLLQNTRDQLLSIPNFGEKGLKEVYKALDGIGFKQKR
ncbi:MAG: DNA-directed RNA polymerase subunit alpha C-terminal domain-containing protein [Patescibacteria group bacterium]